VANPNPYAISFENLQWDRTIDDTRVPPYSLYRPAWIEGWNYPPTWEFNNEHDPITGTSRAIPIDEPSPPKVLQILSYEHHRNVWDDEYIHDTTPISPIPSLEQTPEPEGPEVSPWPFYLNIFSEYPPFTNADPNSQVAVHTTS
jgi:hypothetical protein